MIQIAPSILNADYGKIEEVVKTAEAAGSSIFKHENPQDVIIKMKEIASKNNKS